MSGEELAAELPNRRERLASELAGWGVDGLLVTNPSDLRYLTGFGGTTDLGPNPFTGGASAALVVTPGGSLLCLPESDVASVPDSTLELETYPTFLELSPLFPRRHFTRAVLSALDRAGARRGRLGFQEVSLPSVIRGTLAEELPRVELRELDGTVAVVRMRKSEAEVAAIRRSVALCDLAQATVRELARPGTRELDILAAVRQRIEAQAAAALALIHEITSGPKTGRIGNTAGERELQEGDFLLTDIAPQLDGYWGDSCATQVVGGAGAEQARMLDVAAQALAMGTDAVRPGARTSDVDRLMREHVASAFTAYPNSGGHGIGLDYHEPPRLVPAEEIHLEEGMVIALEPGMYLGEAGGVRLEHLVLVTHGGCEVLSRHLDGNL